MPDVFAVPVFFICFRECLETSIIVSILLVFLKQTLGQDADPEAYKKLRRQVWLGTACGLLVCLIVGAAFIGVFYRISIDHWAASENIWEGVFSLLASIIITFIGAALLRISKLQDKWRMKLARALTIRDEAKNTTGSSRLRLWSEKYAMFILPFITVLREGLEAVVFIGGVGLGLPASSFPLAVICGILLGVLIGYVIYKGGNFATLQIFLIISTCFLYLIAAGLFSKAIWNFEADQWNKEIGGDAAETGDGPGSYDIRKSVWHLNCCSPQLNGGGGWGVFNSLFGWQNSATYGSVLSYNLYWLVVIIGFLAMQYRDKKGHWPLMKAKAQTSTLPESGSDEDTNGKTVLTKERNGKGISTTESHKL